MKYRIDAENTISGLGFMSLVGLVVYLVIKMPKPQVVVPEISIDFFSMFYWLMWGSLGIVSMTTLLLLANAVGEIVNGYFVKLGKRIRK